MCGAKDPVDRLASADIAQQLLNTACTGNSTNFGFRQPETGAFREDAEVARQSKLATTTEGKAIDRGDGRKCQFLKPVEKHGDASEVRIAGIERFED